MTIRMAILNDVLALLSAGAPPVAPKRSYTFSITAAKSLIVHGIREEQPEPIGGNRFTASHVKRRFHIGIECRATGTATTKADDEADSVIAWALKTVCGKQKGTQDGKLYHLLVEGETEIKLDQADHQYCIASIDMIAEYQTKRNDPEVWE